MKRLLGGLLGLHALLVLGRSIRRGRHARQGPRPATAPTHTAWPFVSVIIPAWRDAAALRACLGSLALVDYPDYEVVVVAGGPDGTHDAACAAAERMGRIRVVEQLPRGKNAALNQGLALATADILVLLDADSELSPQWLKGLVGALQGDAAASTGNYLPLHETPISLWGDVAKVYEYQVRGRVILQGSGGIAVRREVLDVVGPFPEERISSDWDLDARLALRGYRRVFAADASIRSHRPATLPEWWRNELRWRRLHLRSLLRLKGGLLTEPVAAARHLYPYVTSWAAALVSAAVLLTLPFARVRGGVRVAWAALLGFMLLREAEPVAAVLAYRPARRWLPVVPITSVMAVLTWAACCVASLTRDKAALQFKGPRNLS